MEYTEVGVGDDDTSDANDSEGLSGGLGTGIHYYFIAGFVAASLLLLAFFYVPVLSSSLLKVSHDCHVYTMCTPSSDASPFVCRLPGKAK